MGEKNKDEKKQLVEDNQGVHTVQNQLNESFQKGVIEEQLENNKGVNHFNNKNR